MKSNQPFRILCILSALAGLDVARTCTAADWPTWRGDAARSAVTAERLPAALTWHWTLQLPTPQPAWPDDQGKIRFDASYEPVVAQGHLLVPSMVDDSVAAYRLADAALVWRFYAEGPVRFAPVVHGDRVLFVSDDGYLYCVAADRGSLIWKLRGGPQDRELLDRKLLGNDRLISMWPARGAPVVWGRRSILLPGSGRSWVCSSTPWTSAPDNPYGPTAAAVRITSSSSITVPLLLGSHRKDTWPSTRITSWCRAA